MRQVTSNVKERAPSWRFSRSKLNGIISQVSSKRCLFCNSGFSNSNYVKYFICALDLSRWSRPLKFLFKEHALIWNKARDLCLLGNFKVWIWSMLQYLELTTFTGSLFFSRERNYAGEPSQRKVLVKANLHHSWYLVEREFDMEYRSYQTH